MSIVDLFKACPFSSVQRVRSLIDRGFYTPE